jgi:exocyst complex component 1
MLANTTKKEFIESTESVLASLPPGTPPSSLAARSSHSRSLFKKLLSSNDGRETRKGIDLLKKRIDKHFGDADEMALSRNLVVKVLKECQASYEDVWDRTQRVGKEVYESSEGGSVEWDIRRDDIGAAFRK